MSMMELIEKAPEGATHYKSPIGYYHKIGSLWHVWVPSKSRWEPSAHESTPTHMTPLRTSDQRISDLPQSYESPDRIVVSPDPVNHPAHYQSEDGIECIDAIRAALGLEGFVAHCRGTAIKYAWRSGKKQRHAEDLRKAAWYLTKAAEELEK